jgi:predicted nucleotidyltransferase component of viral defense system
MSRQSPRNMAASVRERLLTVARETHEDFNLILTRYALERLLYRIGQSRYSDQFVLKGAMLFLAWMSETHRPTRDLDLLGRGESSPESSKAIFRELCAISANDGIAFDENSVQSERIREDELYEGVRVTLLATLAKARIAIQVDIGFGDAITPPPVETDYPTLLDMPAPRLRTYPRETVVAEKFEAMVKLGLANTRMKDFYDVWLLAQEMSFDGSILSAAIAATFERRNTELPKELPRAFQEQFLQEKQVQWLGFIRKSQPRNAADLQSVLGLIERFLMPPVLDAARNGDFHQHWPPGGPWS